MNFKPLAALATLALSLAAATPAHASLYTNSFGSALANSSNCDDCYDGPISFGAGQSLNFFGATYSDLYVGSNGYVTFGAGATSWTTASLDTQVVGKMIAGMFTDLDSRSDAASNVYVDTSTLGQIIVTWSNMGQYSQNYTVRNTFQLVIRSDEFAIASGEGQIGFFYGETATAGQYSAAAGFGDGLAAVNAGEVAFYTGTGSGLSNNAPRWYNLSNSVPVETTVPEPGSLALLGVSALALAAVRRVRRA